MDINSLQPIIHWLSSQDTTTWILSGLWGLSEWLGSSDKTKIKSVSGIVAKVYRAIKAIEVFEQSQTPPSVPK
jgi:hypothetical protein